jgi:Na+/H+ antiporter NhaC
MACATDHIDHVSTQLPYALLAAGGATLLFAAFGFVL